ncbi:DUF3466 family protein [Candidatus Nitrosacidococcus sp. I8]|uniref:DUF3466 family protein n=1 Tax=Candidatus Nitrosacidococcus sp. I8 TaxID=2942908 RepID=UPI002225FC59|nr:DUF3466 family protein [Candidatus Nitrosacidococcus sp. I8]CAH9016946.1 hypothetical protein NURINAE_00266 [Candidatus Nitrosacidococcus sp. I8]
MGIPAPNIQNTKADGSQPPQGSVFNSQVVDMNNQGQVVGFYNYGVSDNTRNPKGFIGDSHGIKDLNTVLPLEKNYSLPFMVRINDQGQIAGVYIDSEKFSQLDSSASFETIASVYHAFITDPSDQSKLVLLDAKSLSLSTPTYISHIFGLNNQGQIIGILNNGSAFIGNIQSEITLLTSSSRPDSFITPSAISDSGQVVGSFQFADNQAFFGYSQHGFVSGEGGKIYDLNDFIIGGSNYVIGSAIGIDNSGQILTGGRSSAGSSFSTLFRMYK